MLDGSQSAGSPQAKRVRSSLGRRGALGALAALVATTLGKVTERPAEANDPNDLVLNTSNAVTGFTAIVNQSASGTPVGLFGQANAGIGLWGRGGTYGVFGEAQSAGFGILGFSQSGYGVLSQTTSGVGFYGLSTNSVGGWGVSINSIGLFGQSTNNVAVQGATGGGVGVLATATTGVALRTSGPTEFRGNVEIGDFEIQGSALYNLNITGDLKVNGQKSAIVRGADGEFRQFYCLESPENFFEDFGTARLDRGKVTVKLDDEFRYFVAPRRGFYVFLTPLADTPGLYVVLGDDSFEVREVGNRESNIPFQYRVVCTRKDVPGKRLERVNPSKPGPGRRRVPQSEIKTPTPPPMPTFRGGPNVPQPTQQLQTPPPPPRANP
jgi:hypothetical protein